MGYTRDKYLGITKTDSIKLRERGIVKTGRKSRKDGWRESEELDTQITWSEIAYQETKN